MNPLFDTLRATRRLQEYGYSERQAEGVVTVLEDALHEGVATKSDLNEVRQEIDQLRREMREEIKQLRNEMQQLEERMKRWTLRLAITCMGISLSVGLGGVALMFKFMGG